MSLSPHGQLLQECIRASLPEAYHADVWTHDATCIENLVERTGSCRFVWALGECGSHFFGSDVSVSQLLAIADDMDNRGLRSSRRRYYYFDGESLTRFHSATDAVQAMRNHTAREQS